MASEKAKSGDTFWTMLRRVTKSDNILADSPYENSDIIIISRKSVEERTPIEVPPHPVKATTAIDPTIEHSIFVEVIDTKDDQIYAESLPLEKWPKKCPRGLKTKPGEINSTSSTNRGLFDKKRENRITWRGSDQKSSSESVKNRSKTFKEGDVRGKANDLINGNM